MRLKDKLEKIEELALKKGMFKRWRKFVKCYVVCWYLHNSGLSIRQISDISEYLFGRRVSKSSIHRAIKKIDKVVSTEDYIMNILN